MLFYWVGTPCISVNICNEWSKYMCIINRNLGERHLISLLVLLVIMQSLTICFTRKKKKFLYWVLFKHSSVSLFGCGFKWRQHLHFIYIYWIIFKWSLLLSNLNLADAVCYCNYYIHDDTETLPDSRWCFLSSLTYLTLFTADVTVWSELDFLLKVITEQSKAYSGYSV